MGLTAAIDLRLRGVDVVVLEATTDAAEGSRAICFAKRSLEIFSRLGAGEGMLAKGVRWNKGKVFRGEDVLYEFDLLPEEGHGHPAFVNLQQYYCEQFLLRRLREIAPDCLRSGHKVTEVRNADSSAVVTAETAAGAVRFEGQYVLACDGAKSSIRESCGLGFVGEVFRDRFLISDIKMRSDFPSERWFWFDPPFHPGNSALLHKQPDDVWRIDLQLGWHADPVAERQPEKIIPRLHAMLGADVKFELEWVSVYAFQSRRMESFVHGRIFFAGDSAHQVSPFGARGANSGIQDVDNLCWKIALVLKNGASESLLETYNDERIPAADSNIRHSSQSTNFIAPQNRAAKGFRDAALDLAATNPRLRSFVNSGRLSTAARYDGSALNGADEFDSQAGCVGSAPPDAPVESGAAPGWFLARLGSDFNLVVFAPPQDESRAMLASHAARLPLRYHFVTDATDGSDCLADPQDMLLERCGVESGAAVLLRPDGHICARLRAGDILERGLATVAGICGQGRAQ